MLEEKKNPQSTSYLPPFHMGVAVDICEASLSKGEGVGDAIQNQLYKLQPLV